MMERLTHDRRLNPRIPQKVPGLFPADRSRSFYDYTAYRGATMKRTGIDLSIIKNIN